MNAFRKFIAAGGLLLVLRVAAWPAEEVAPGAYPYKGAPPPPPKPLPVLLVTGCDYPRHVWSVTAPHLAAGLRQDPRVDVRTIEDPHFLDSAALGRYRVIVLHFMNWMTPGPGPAARANLQRFVEAGGGLVLVHFACGAWLEWPDFAQLAGRVWDPKLRSHDPRGPFHVDIIRPEHPIMQGLGAGFDVDDELYTCLRGATPVEVLATARSRIDHREYPMAFTLTVGRGRVFQSPLGHDIKAFGPDTLELFRRGVAWAAGLDPVPPRPAESAPTGP